MAIPGIVSEPPTAVFPSSSLDTPMDQDDLLGPPPSDVELEEEDEHELSPPSSANAVQPLVTIDEMVENKVEIADLFDFSTNYWGEYEQRTGSISLDEEMELYELLDLDASGHADLDLDPDLDDTVANIFNM